MTARLLRGIGANLYAQIVTAIIQLVAVPVLLGLWGPFRYGLWTLMSAIPAALAFADGGLVLATGTAMTMAAARGEAATAAALFRRAVRTVGFATLAVALVAGIAVVAIPPRLLAAGLPGGETRILLLCLALVTLAGVVGALPGAAFRADGRYAYGVVLGATLRAGETAAVLVAAGVGGLIGAAGAWLLVRGIGVLVQFILVRRLMPWLREPVARPSEASTLAPLLRPALAAVALPAAFAVSLQGATLAIGLVLPPAAVAAFVTARTLARLVVQLSGLVNHALVPEMSRVAGRGDAAAAANMLRFSRAAASALLLPGWALLLLAGPRLLQAWTTGRLSLPAGVLPLVATAALVHGVWLARANLLLAVNRQSDYAWMFLVVSGLTTVATAFCAQAGGLAAAAAAGLAGEIVMALWIAWTSRSRPVDVPTPARLPNAEGPDGATRAGSRPTVTAVLAAHNRRAKTLACLDSLMIQTAACDLRVILFDDASSDGTAAAVRQRHPGVEILTGTGDAFWAGGMRRAFMAARTADPDFVLWLNDDVRLAPQALVRLLDAYAERVAHGFALCLIGGGVADPVDGRTTYAGIRRPTPTRPLRFRHEPPHPSEAQRCDTLLGNVVLVPRLTAETVGGIDPAYRQTLADLDYGLRVAAAGGWVGLAPGHVGWCVRETATGRWFDGTLPLRRRWWLVNRPHGLPLRPWLHFARRHGGPCWMLFAPLPYWRLFVPVRLARRVDRRRAPAPQPSAELRHA